MTAKIYYFHGATGAINPHRAGHAPGSTFDRLMADSAPTEYLAQIDALADTINMRAIVARDVPGDGVQAWSKGALYPAIIAVVEHYSDLPAAEYTSYELTFQGHSEEYATWEDAEMVARALISRPDVAAQWGIQS